MILDKLINDTIIVTNNNNKNNLIEYIRSSDKVLNIKFLTINELRDALFFSYDEKSIYYLIEKFHLKYDVCLKYLKNLYYIKDDDFNNIKLKKLFNIKKELLDNNLLYFNTLFRESLKDRKIIFYNLNYLSKYDRMIVNELEKITSVEFFNDTLSEYNHEYVYECDTIENEVVFVANSICKLINRGIDINDIKICGINDEYKSYIKRVFGLYNIPINFNDNCLYATVMGQDFLNNMNNSFLESLSYIYNKYNMKDNNIINIYNSIVNILNKYVFCDNLLNVRDMIIQDFKREKVNTIYLDREIEIISSLDSFYDKYVFLMNFNQGMVPTTIKDIDYLGDNLKRKLGIDTTSDLNKISHDKWLYDILHCKNLVLSYKKNSLSGEFYISSLSDDLNLKVIKPEYNYSYSNIYNKIKLTSCIDNLVKYNICTKELELLFNNYKDIKYMVYDNKYNKINIDNLKKYLGNKLVLSYSAINNYYHCAFKYYLSNVLKINIFEETFYTIIGNLFHYILSICFDDDIDIKKYYYDYLNNLSYEFNSREQFFLDNLLQELLFIINTIKKQYNYTSLSNSLYEDRIEIDISKDNMKIIFKGFIDKIMLDNDKKIGAIIDYKTGNPNILLNNSIYGLDLQLPVYIYLTKYKFPNIRIVGFYLQKILNSEVSIDKKKSYLELREDKLKLQGYTNKDENLISLFDSNYSNSKVIKGMRTSSKGISSKKILDDTSINNLSKLTESKINEAINGIMDANFNINPKRVGKNNLGCLYCKFKDICFMKEDDIVNLEEYKDIDFITNVDLN